MIHRIALSNNPVEISLDNNNKSIARFTECDEEELSNYKTIDVKTLYIPSILLYDFKYLCFNHLPLYEYDKGEWYKMTEDCDCESRIYLWCKNDLHLRIGEDVANRAKNAINILQKIGYYYQNTYSNLPLILSFDDFMKYSAKRIYLLGSILSNIVKIGTKLPHHLFGLFEASCFIYNINFMTYGDDNSKIYFLKTKSRRHKNKMLYCKNCNKIGHTIGFCYKMNIKCFKCKKYGHVYIHCTLK